MRDFFSPGRSPAMGRTGAVASSHTLASGLALSVLAEGGNAMDAAVTATFAMCVIEPQSTGIGGDCFALVHPAGAAQPVAFNGSGRTPRGLDPVRARAEGGAPLAEASVHAVTVPGLVDGLEQLLARFGTWPLARVLDPAIALAETGFAVMQRTADEWAAVAPKLAADPETREMLLPDGRAPQPGQVFRAPALARTLRRIAAEGAEPFYRGELGRCLAAFLMRKGGAHEAADFASHAGQFVQPVSLRYGGCDIWQCPPNGQGLTALAMLHLLDDHAIRALPFDSAERHGHVARAARAAMAQRDRLIADPEMHEVTVQTFLRTISCSEDISCTVAARGDTAYVAAVDRNGAAVSLISSLFAGFGSGLCDPDTGVVFHNRGSGFSGRETHPNALGPSKRPLHTIMPGLVTREGRPTLCFGVTGGPYQPTGQVQIATGVLDHGLDIQAAIDRPRSFWDGSAVRLEPGLAAAAPVMASLGFEAVPAESAIGGAHGIMIDWESGVLTGGSDPRKDGAALAI